KLAATLDDPGLKGDAHQDVIRSLAFDPTGDLLASGAFREVKLWRRPRTDEIARWPHEAPVRAVAVSTDGKSAATGDDTGTIRLWDIASGKTSHTIAAHRGGVTGLTFAVDGATLFACSLDKTL